MGTMNVAIDGPAGAGKSTIAKLVAKKLGYIYVDTGAMYRALAVFFIDHKTDTNDEKQIEAAIANVDVDITYEDGAQQIILNGENVTGRLRTQEVGDMASKTATFACVRTKLVELQRKLAATSNVVMDGRDIGTVVLPNASVKIYLTASVSTRALRRFKELEEKGENPILADIEREIEDRDYRDMHREVSPLRQAEDAILVDSSDMTIEEVCDAIMKECR